MNREVLLIDFSVASLVISGLGHGNSQWSMNGTYFSAVGEKQIFSVTSHTLVQCISCLKEFV